MPRCPSLKGKNGIGGPTVRLSLGRGAGRRAEHGHRTHRNTSPPFLQLGKCRPRAPGGPRGRSARCGNGLFAQCVRLRSEINHHLLTAFLLEATLRAIHLAPIRFPIPCGTYFLHVVYPTKGSHRSSHSSPAFFRRGFQSSCIETASYDYPSQTIKEISTAIGRR